MPRPSIKVIPLRILLPVAILLIGLVTTAVTFFIAHPMVREEVIKEQTELHLLAASRLQTILEASARFDDGVFTQEILSVATTSSSAISSMIVDNSGAITAASSFDRVGLMAGTVLDQAALVLIPQVQQSVAPATSIPNDSLTLTTAVRLCYDRSTARIPKNPCDTLVTRHDLSDSYNQHLRMLYAELALNIVSVVCAAFATFALIWYKLLLPLRRIRETLQSYMGGKTESRIALEGGGEVVLIAGEIDFLLDYLEETKESHEFSEQRFRALFQNNTEGMIVITGQGFITDVNQAAEAIFGYAPGELIGARVERLMPAEHADKHGEYLTRYLSTGEARVIGTTGRELHGIRKNGARFPLRLGIGEVRSGHANYFVATIIDLTEIAELQGQLERSQHPGVID